MKRKGMNFRYKILCSMIIATLAFTAVAYPEDKFKLKTGAKGEICLSCHDTFQDALKSRYLHPLLKTGQCTGCHNPHTSSYKTLLTEDVSKLCSNCHKKVIPEMARSTHEVVVEGNCVKCHNPHASNNKFILTKAGNELCFECHRDMAAETNEARFKHKPVRDGCITCHNPHASTKFDFLLKKDVPSLCLECHKSDKPEFARQHMNYPVAAANCASCHDTHGSNKKAMIFDKVHAPVADKQCSSCHEEPDAPNPFKTKKDGVELCMACHKDMIEKTFNKNRIHWPLVDKTGCLNCHSAHAAKQENLLKGTIINVCGKCHSDTVELQEISINNPKNERLCAPVKAGNCIACHSPHSSDYVLLAPKPSFSFNVCQECHDWQQHSTHPVGEDYMDQRNANLSTNCLSCHKTCGTGNRRAMMHFDTIKALCTQCHVEFKR